MTLIRVIVQIGHLTIPSRTKLYGICRAIVISRNLGAVNKDTGKKCAGSRPARLWARRSAQRWPCETGWFCVINATTEARSVGVRGTISSRNEDATSTVPAAGSLQDGTSPWYPANYLIHIVHRCLALKNITVQCVCNYCLVGFPTNKCELKGKGGGTGSRWCVGTTISKYCGASRRRYPYTPEPATKN